MRNTADPRVAGCRRAHRSRVRQLQLLGRAEHVHGDEAVRAVGCGERSATRPAAGCSRVAGGDRGRGGKRASRPRHRADRARLQGGPHAHRHERSVLVYRSTARCDSSCTSKPGAACAMSSSTEPSSCATVASRPSTRTKSTMPCEAVMPGFRRDFTAISERVQRLQPWLDAGASTHRLDRTRLRPDLHPVLKSPQGLAQTFAAV